MGFKVRKLIYKILNLNRKYIICHSSDKYKKKNIFIYIKISKIICNINLQYYYLHIIRDNVKPSKDPNRIGARIEEFVLL